MAALFDTESTLKPGPAPSEAPEPDLPVNHNQPVDSNAVTVQNVGRTERRPTKGAPPSLRSEEDRASIRKQQADQVKRMNQQAHQSTDSTN